MIRRLIARKRLVRRHYNRLTTRREKFYYMASLFGMLPAVPFSLRGPELHAKTRKGEDAQHE